MSAQPAVLNEPRTIDRETLADSVADTVICHAIGPAELQAACEFLRCDIAIGIVYLRHLLAPAANVVKAAGNVTEIAPHVELDCAFMGSLEEDLAMVAGLGNRGVQARRGVERAKCAIGKAAAVGIDMGERRHDDGRPGTEHPVFRCNELDFSYFIAQAWIRERFEPVQSLPILRARDPLEEIDGRKAARDDPKTRLPAHLADGGCRVGNRQWGSSLLTRRVPALARASRLREASWSVRRAHYPRWASKYCRTMYSSTTWPESMRSSADLPPNRGASLGRRTHSSAA